MATNLTETAFVARRVIKYGTFLIIFLIVARVVIGAGYNIYRRYRPKPPPPPNFLFGTLPEIKFPENKDAPTGFSLKIETPQGTFPKFPTSVKVFFSPRPTALFSSLENAKDKARRLGFLQDGQRETDTLYVFQQQRSSARLNIDIVTGSFSISYDLSSDPGLLITKPLSTEVAASAARSYLSSAGLLPLDLGPVTYEFLKATPEGLKTVVSLSEANFVRVNFFRDKYDDLPSLGPNPTRGNIWLLVSGARERERQIIAAEYHYFAVDSENSGTYPTKNIELAWEELRGGKAYIASLGGAGDGQVTIRRIYLAYYDSSLPQEFLQPIFVFEGDRGFVAYTSAVGNETQGGK